MDYVSRTLKSLVRTLGRSLLTWLQLTPPARIDVRPLKEESNMLIYSAAVPAAVDVDAVAIEVTKDVAGVMSGETFPKEGGSFEIAASDNDVVTLTTVVIDDAGNRSEPTVQSFTATDTIAPAKPGEIAVTLLREE